MDSAFFYFLAFFLLTGCGATGVKFSGSESLDVGKASLYIYRPSAFYQGGRAPKFFINGEIHHTLRNGGFLHYSLQPGLHKLKLGKESFFTNWGTKAIEWKVNLKPNRKYFYRLDVNFEGLGFTPMANALKMSGSVRVLSIPEEKAIREMNNLNSSK